MSDAEFGEVEKEEEVQVGEQISSGEGGAILQMMSLLMKERADNELRRVQELNERRAEKQQELDILRAEKEQEVLQKKQELDILRAEKEQEFFAKDTRV